MNEAQAVISLTTAVRDMSFNDALDRAGYDLVFVDFHQPGADLRSNALLIQEVIRRINAMKSGANQEQNVVMGMSMGGLLGRMALARMHEQGENHETRLLITHDSPHRGVNIPLGFQRALESMSQIPIIPGSLTPEDISAALRRAKRTLSSTAVQQMLIDHDLNQAPFMENQYRQWIQGRNGNIGCEMITTSNGSDCGSPQEAIPGQTFARIEANIRANIGLQFSLQFLALFPPVGTAIAAGVVGLPHFVPFNFRSVASSFLLIPMSFIPGTVSEWEVELTVRALQEGSRVRVFQGKMISRKIILVRIPVDVVLWNTNRHSNPASFSWDSAAGSTASMGREDVTSTTTGFVDVRVFPDQFDAFCFVPTFSALDADAPITPALLTQQFPVTTRPNTRIRSHFVAPQMATAELGVVNEPHIEFTNWNADWIFQHMENPVPPAPVDCSALCAAREIVGGDICTGGTLFQVTNLVPGSTVQWRHVNGPAVSFSNPNAAVTSISPQGTFLISGLVTLEVEITDNTCAVGTSEIITGQFWLGPPNNSATFALPVTPCDHTLNNTLTINAIPGADHYVWTSQSAQVSLAGQSTFVTATPYLPNVSVGNAGNYVVEVFAENDCGASATLQIPVNVRRCISQFVHFKTYPNPATSHLYVARNEEAGFVGQAFTATLYNPQMQPIAEKHSEDGQPVRFDTHEFHDGVYIVIFKDAEHTEQGKVLIGY